MENKLFTIDYKKELNTELNNLFKWGALVLTLFGLFCSGFIFIVKKLSSFNPSVYMAEVIIINSVIFFFLYILAKKNMIRGFIQYLVIFYLSSLPTFVILSSQQ